MYGYKIINGRAVIDEQEAGTIISIINGFISGLSMKAAAANAGVLMQHSAVKRILMRDIYIGNMTTIPQSSAGKPSQRQTAEYCIVRICTALKSGIPHRRYTRRLSWLLRRRISMIRQSKPNTFIV